MNDALRLEATRARSAIASGALRGASLAELIGAVPFCDRDSWVDAIFGLDGAPPDVPDLPRGSVPYLPCGVDEILTMVRDVPLRPEDEVVDLGSGLGRVAILAHLLSGARAHGIEIQEHLVRGAKVLCTELGVTGVSFVHADAAETELDGSVFFLYAPFNGPMLRTVLRRLEEVAQRRAVVVCAVGLELDGEAWLRPRPLSTATLAIYDSRERGDGRSSVEGHSCER